MLDVAIRPAVPDDMRLVWSATLKSLRERYPYRHAEPHAYNVAMTAELTALTARASVAVACDPDEPSTLFGFVIFEPTALHYVYVKFAFRGYGVARELLTHACPTFGREPAVCTHLPEPAPHEPGEAPPTTSAVLAKHRLVYRPYHLEPKGPCATRPNSRPSSM